MSCPICNTVLEADVDTEMGDDGKYRSYYTTAFCPRERECEAPYCTASTHETCSSCGENVCPDHRLPNGECVICRPITQENP